MLNRKQPPPIQDAAGMELLLPPYEHFTLKNGTPVYTIEAGSQEVVQIELLFYAGLWYEDFPLQASTTNFLLKNGTRKKTSFQLNEQVEFYGAYLNRGCFNDVANITLHCLNKHLTALLPILSEVLTESVFPEDELAIYRNNQLQRLNINLKKCDFVANRLMDVYLYGEQHPYGRYSTAEAYETITREQLVAFYERYYVNGSCMIMVSGRLPADLRLQLEACFGDLPMKGKLPDERWHSLLPAQQHTYRIVNDEQGIQGAIRLARPAPNRKHPDFIGMQMLNDILGGYFSSRLMSNIREDKGYTYGIHSYLHSHLHEGSWHINTEVGRQFCEAAVTEINKELILLCEEKVSKEELDNVRNYMLGGLMGDLDGPFQIMARWKTYLLNELPEHYFDESIETIRAMTPQQLQDLSVRYLSPKAFYELVVI